MTNRGLPECGRRMIGSAQIEVCIPAASPPTLLARVQSGISFCAVWRKTVRTSLAGSLRQRMEFRVEISSPFESHVCLSGTDKMDLHSTQPLASNAALLSPSRMNGVREIWQARRRRRRSDKSFICQFQHLARPPSAFSQAELWRGA